jgi:hypothetical protein
VAQGDDVRWVVFSVILVACTPLERPLEEQQPPPQEAEPQEAQPPAIAHEVTDVEVVWPTTAVDHDALAQLPAGSALVVARSPVPALVVNRERLLNDARVMAKARWYAVSTRGDGVTVSIHATQTAHRYPHLPVLQGPALVRGQAAFVTQNESIWSAAWIEGGVAYSLEVECDALPDPRCETDTFLLSLAAELTYVGGEGS